MTGAIAGASKGTRVAEFLDTAVSFPAAVFGILLVIVIAYWAIVLLGVLGDGFFDADADADGDVGIAGLLGAVGLGGVPAAVVVSLWIAFGWFTSFVGAEATGEMSGLVRVAAGTGVVALALGVGYAVTFLVVIPLRKIMPAEAPPPRRADLVGRTCVVRTTTVDNTHGQAEVTAEDGSSAVIQVRQTGEEALNAGTTALIFDYDADGEFFWITAAPAHLNPEP